jgi:NAD(P)-dependent dehydrogenase (short-subunit alcohol dehydrogenase family)
MVTGLVNNAGLTAHIGDLADTPVEVIRRVIDVNLVGVVLCARRAAQLMSVRRGGRGGAIVNISSAAATLGSAHEYVHYAAAKAAVDALTRTLAVEWGTQNIRVNAIAPGPIGDTEGARRLFAGEAADMLRGAIPTRRLGTIDDIVNLALFVLSEAGTNINGAILVSDGGLHLVGRFGAGSL